MLKIITMKKRAGEKLNSRQPAYEVKSFKLVILSAHKQLVAKCQYLVWMTFA